MPTLLEPYRKKSDGFHKMRDGSLFAGSGGSDPGGTTGSTIPAVSATKLRASFGTRVFPSYSSGTGGQLVTSSVAKGYLTALNPGMVTHKITPAVGQDIVDWINEMWNDYGIKSVLTIGEPFETYTDAQWSTMMTRIGNCQDAIYMVNGQNEVNNVRGTGTLPANWAQIAADHQKRLWAEMNTGSTALNNVRIAAGKGRIWVGNPNLWSGSDAVHDRDAAILLPLVSGYVDMPNYHLYPRGGDPNYKLDEYAFFYHKYLEPVAANRVNDPSKWQLGTFCSEGGYFVADNYNGAAAVVTEWAHDIYLRKMLLEYVSRGYRWSQFEFLNDPDPTKTNREASFGFLEMDSVTPASSWTKRTVYAKMQKMMTLGGGTNDPVDCEVTSTATSPFKYLAVRHTNGIKLYLWRPVEIETNRVKNTLSPATVSVTVKTPSGTQTASIGADIVELDI